MTSESLQNRHYRIMRFQKAADTYLDDSRVHIHMAETLLQQLPENFEPLNILEMGCGTGILSRRLRDLFPGSFLMLSDSSPAMLNQCKNRFISGTEKTQWVNHDAMTPFNNPRPGVIDLVISNALVQWLPLENYLNLVLGFLPIKGRCAFSSLTPGTFPEIQYCTNKLGIEFQPPAGQFPGSIYDRIQSEWHIDSLQESDFVSYHSTAWDFFRFIRNLGATAKPNKTGLSKKQFLQLIKCYDKNFKKMDQVPATWKAWYCVLQRK